MPADGYQDRTQEGVLRDIEILSRQRNRLLFDGEWLNPSEVRLHLRRLRWRSLWVIVNTCALVALMLALSYFFYLLVRLLTR